MTYNYNSSEPVKITLDQLTDREHYLLTESKTFCIYPWIHLHAYPTGEAYPCCHAEMQHPVGNCKTKTLQEIWHDRPMQLLRNDMLAEKASPTCARCYEQEAAGFFSGRRSANKHHGHHIHKLDTNPFEMTYWDIRFSNLCNLSCRSCGHIFSSSWYQDQAQLAGTEWRINNQPLTFAGRTETDIWEQLLPHFDHVEQIYFAGGEPLMMAEHYRILDELERRGKFDVRLIYNTNFTQTRLKDRSVFDYWRRFESVAVGASLDAMGPRAEYIRHGTRWDRVVENRLRMLEICPNVDFYISPTLSIMNALHLPDLHRAWVNQGLIRPQDLNVNILQDPAHYRIDIATADYKKEICKKYREHLAWLKPLDPLCRATVGFESAIDFMMATDNTHLLDTFWQRTHQLDRIRGQNVLDHLPELAALT
jgi:radical SAM protein with 4Fe4S-binding SPASM domain